MALARTGGYVCVTGAHGVVCGHSDGAFRDLLNGAAMNTLDGQPLVWLARLKGHRYADRATGRELLSAVIGEDTACRIRHVLVGSTAEVTLRMVKRLRRMKPGINMGPVINPPFRSMTETEIDSLCAQIGSDEPTIVWVGLSTPKQERLACRLSPRLPAFPVVAIGAGFDFVAGLKPIAPRFVTNLGLEWLFRLLLEPRRLFPRYAEIVPKFLLLALREVAFEAYARMVSAPDRSSAEPTA